MYPSPLFQVLFALTSLLRSCTGDPSLPRPTRLLRTKWATDPLHRGSYSYGAVATDWPKHQVSLMGRTN